MSETADDPAWIAFLLGLETELSKDLPDEPVPLAEVIHLIGDWWTTTRDAIPPAPDDGHLAAAEALRIPRGRR